MKKKALSLILTLCLALLLLPGLTAGAAAAEPWESYTELSAGVNGGTLSTGSYKVTADYTGSLTISGNVTIYVKAGVTLTCNGGIACAGLRVPATASLTIDGEGIVKAKGGDGTPGGGGAGIGGNSVGNSNGESCGRITINGCTVTATGGTLGIDTSVGAGAGIGGGGGRAGLGGNATEIVINGGTVTATGGAGHSNSLGGSAGAGIGGGGGTSNSQSGSGTVTINGGTVTATGGKGNGADSGAAGIGGGGHNGLIERGGNGGTVVITGGSVLAKAGAGAEAIGKAMGGADGTLKNATGGTDVSLVTLTLTGAANAPIENFVDGGSLSSYGLKDVKTDADGKLYFYLPSHSITGVTTAPTAATAGLTYTGTAITGNAGTLAALTRLSMPTELSWDGSNAGWKVVTGAAGYYIWLYKDGTTLVGRTGVPTGARSHNFSAAITAAGTGAYSFKVSARGDRVNNSDSEWSEMSAAYYYPPSDPRQGAFNIGEGNITVNKSGDDDLTVTYGGGTTAPFPKDEEITIVGASKAHTVTVNGAAEANITLANVNINVGGTSDACAFKLEGNANVTLTLKGENKLESGLRCAGLQAPANTTLTITGTTADSLTATGGGHGAGIGGGHEGNGGNITIKGGTVTATGGSGGAGIGGGYEGNGGNITIEGGTVTATGGGTGAGIGGGSDISAKGTGNGGTITIKGGTVTATSTNAGAGIGGGFNGNGGDITIEGGTVKATSNNTGAGIGGGDNGEGGNVIISGGSVKATGKQGIGRGFGGNSDGTLKNADEGAEVSLVTLTLTGAADGTAVTDFNTRPDYYGMKDVKTLDTDKIYFYLPTVGHSIDKAMTGEATPRLFTTATADTDNDVTLTLSGNALPSTAPAAAVTTVAKTAATQQAVHFTLTTAPAGTYTVYADDSTNTVHGTVTAALDGSTLTLTDSGGDIAPATYYVAVTERFHLESTRLPLTVGAYVPPTVDNTPTVYPVTEGEGSAWRQGSAAGLAITSDGPFGSFMSAAVDGKAITKNLDYSVTEGSTVVTLKPAYLATLAVGDHTLRLNFAGGYSTATFTIGEQSAWQNPFKDVAADDWFFEDVMYVAENGLMEGTDSDKFSPDGATSRAMVVTTLWRMAGEPKATGKTSFPDVEDGKWYSEAVNWAAENNIAKGYDNGRFGANDPVTREQLATFLYNYAKHKGYDVTPTGDLTNFTDQNEIAGYALPAMQWAVGENLIEGYKAKLTPKAPAKRAQFAAILHRFHKTTTP